MYYDNTNYYDASPRLNTNGDYCGVGQPRGNCDCTECTRLRRLLQHNQPTDASGHVLTRAQPHFVLRDDQQLSAVPRPEMVLSSGTIAPLETKSASPKSTTEGMFGVGDVTHNQLAMLVIFLYVIIVFLAYQHYSLMQMLRQHTAAVTGVSANQ